MKSEIPPEKTKAYWEQQIPDLQRKAKTLTIKKTVRNMFVAAAAVSLFSFALGIIYSDLKPFFICCPLFALFIVVIYLIYFFYAPFIIKRHHGMDPMTVCDCVIYEADQAWNGPYGMEAKDSPINRFFPDSMIVSELLLRYKIKGQNFRFFPYRRFRCICTEEKQKEIENLIHMKEGLTLRKESRRFKVTYKKYSKELVRIDLCDDETYPAHCGFEELTERINIMF
jgi:hypothetical protein